MGQKIHPLALRIQASNRYLDQAWYSKFFFSKLISIDLQIVNYFNTFFKLQKIPKGRFSIYHLPKTTKVYNFFCYPKYSRDYLSRILGFPSGLGSNFLQSKKKRNSGHLHNVNQRSTRNKFLGTSFWQLQNEQLKNSASNRVLSNIKNNLYETSTLNKESLQSRQNIFKFFSKFNLKKDTFINTLENNTMVQNKNVPKAFENPYFLESKNVPDRVRFKNTDFLQSKKGPDFLQSQKNSLNRELQTNLNIFKSFLMYSQSLQNYYKIKQNLKVENSNFFHSLKNIYKSKNVVLYKNIYETKIHSNLETNLSKFYKFPFSLVFFRNNFEWQDAGYFADELVYLLERRISFKRIKKKITNQIALNPNIQGIRITCSGRVGGKSKKAQRAKMDSLKYGQTSLHIFSSKIDFAIRTASTSLGSTGVKVWICYK